MGALFVSNLGLDLKHDHKSATADPSDPIPFVADKTMENTNISLAAMIHGHSLIAHASSEFPDAAEAPCSFEPALRGILTTFSVNFKHSFTESELKHVSHPHCFQQQFPPSKVRNAWAKVLSNS